MNPGLVGCCRLCASANIASLNCFFELHKNPLILYFVTITAAKSIHAQLPSSTPLLSEGPLHPTPNCSAQSTFFPLVLLRLHQQLNMKKPKETNKDCRNKHSKKIHSNEIRSKYALYKSRDGMIEVNDPLSRRVCGIK